MEQSRAGADTASGRKRRELRTNALPVSNSSQKPKRYIKKRKRNGRPKKEGEGKSERFHREERKRGDGGGRDSEKREARKERRRSIKAKQGKA